MTPEAAAPGLRGGHHVRHQQRVRVRLPARQHGHAGRGHGPARALLRDRGRGRLDPHRRGAHAADHQRHGGRLGQVVPGVRAHRAAPAPRPRLRGRRGEDDRRGHSSRGSTASRPSWASTTCTTQINTPLVHHLQNAIRAKELYKRDVDYIVRDGEVLIVDEFTGRVLEGRRYSEGLHQAIEAKEGVRIKEENQTLATITIQNYFRMYDKLAGMTGTAQDAGPRVRGGLQARRRRDPDEPPDGPRRPAGR